MSRKIRVIHYGLGPMGARIAKLVTQKEGMEIVGAIEQVNIGKDVGEVVGLDRKLGVVLSSDVDAVLSQDADIVVHATGSFLPQVKEQLLSVVKAGINVVSTCEELAYPEVHHPEVAKELDRLAKQYKVTVLGTGVNPGFRMDTLALFLAGPCEDVKKLRITVIQEAGTRRLPLQKKIGAGMDIEEWQKLAGTTIRHIGLTESLRLVADSLGFKLDEVTETFDPIISDKTVQTEYITVQKGKVAGIHQIARGLKDGEELIRLDIQIYTGTPGSKDSICIEGTPDIEMTISPGIHGDIGTTAMVVNAIPRVINAQPGMLTMNDIPPAHPYLGDWGTLLEK